MSPPLRNVWLLVFAALTLGGITGGALGLLDVRPTLVGGSGAYELVSCRPQEGVCLIFDSAEGRLHFIPLPKLSGPGASTKGTISAWELKTT